MDELDATTACLQNYNTSPAHLFTRFTADFDNLEKPTKFRDQEVKGGKKDIDFAKRSIQQLVSSTIVYIERRFESQGILKDCDIFDPSNFPATASDMAAVTTYGNEELDRILKHFELLIPNAGEVTDQWLRLKVYVCKRVPLRDRHYYSLWPNILANHLRFSAIMKVISLVSLFPMNTACCERGFSVMNRLKTKARSRMNTDMLNSLMHICTDDNTIETFNPQPAVNFWSKDVCRRPGVRNPRAASGHGELGDVDTDSLVDSDTTINITNESDTEDM